MENGAGDLISCSPSEKRRFAKIKTHFARIIVGGTAEKPCYSIMWFDPADREYNVGFGSYDLGYVFQWLSEEFEITGDNFTNEPVRHGRWEKASEHMPIYVCSERKERNLFKNGDNVLSNYCPNCGAKMDKQEKENER